MRSLHTSISRNKKHTREIHISVASANGQISDPISKSPNPMAKPPNFHGSIQTLTPSRTHMQTCAGMNITTRLWQTAPRRIAAMSTGTARLGTPRRSPSIEPRAIWLHVVPAREPARASVGHCDRGAARRQWQGDRERVNAELGEVGSREEIRRREIHGRLHELEVTGHGACGQTEQLQAGMRVGGGGMLLAFLNIITRFPRQ